MPPHENVDHFRQLCVKFAGLCPLIDAAVLCAKPASGAMQVLGLRLTATNRRPQAVTLEDASFFALRRAVPLETLDEMLIGVDDGGISIDGLTAHFPPHKHWVSDDRWWQRSRDTMPERPSFRVTGSGHAYESAFANSEAYYRWLSSIARSDEVYDVKEVAERLGLGMVFADCRNHRVTYIELELPLQVDPIHHADAHAVVALATDIGSLPVTVKFRDELSARTENRRIEVTSEKTPATFLLAPKDDRVSASVTLLAYGEQIWQGEFLGKVAGGRGESAPAPDAEGGARVRPPMVGYEGYREESVPKNVILFLAANPDATSRLALDQECAAIERELKMAPRRDDFVFVAKWAVTVDELMRHLNEHMPTVVHFSGHGGGSSGLLLHADEGAGSQKVTSRALAMMIGAATAKTRLVVLNACYSEAQADELRRVVEAVIGMDGSIGDDAARTFAVAFYRALAHRRSVGNALRQAVATLAGKQMHDERLPMCKTREGVDVEQFHLFESSTAEEASSGPQ